MTPSSTAPARPSYRSAYSACCKKHPKFTQCPCHCYSNTVAYLWCHEPRSCGIASRLYCLNIASDRSHRRCSSSHHWPLRDPLLQSDLFLKQQSKTVRYHLHHHHRHSCSWLPQAASILRNCYQNCPLWVVLVVLEVWRIWAALPGLF